MIAFALKAIVILIAIGFSECFLTAYIEHFFIEDGTVWCGSGNRAIHCDDLGQYVETDKCCQQHDMCPYTFTKDSNQHGFQSRELFTMSHCECDLVFRECLNEKPYKENSYPVWERFEILKLKCVAYLPCSENQEEQIKFENIYENKLERQTGSCVNTSRVMVFDSSNDYTEYLSKNLNKNQLEMTKDLLYTLQKKKFKCSKSPVFLEYPSKIIENFKENFLASKTTSTVPSSQSLKSLVFVPAWNQTKTKTSWIEKKLIATPPESSLNEMKANTFSSKSNKTNIFDFSNDFSSFFFKF
jgi:secretory phospholipase A2